MTLLGIALLTLLLIDYGRTKALTQMSNILVAMVTALVVESPRIS